MRPRRGLVSGILFGILTMVVWFVIFFTLELRSPRLEVRALNDLAAFSPLGLLLASLVWTASRTHSNLVTVLKSGLLGFSLGFGFCLLALTLVMGVGVPEILFGLFWESLRGGLHIFFYLYLGIAIAAVCRRAFSGSQKATKQA